MSYLSLGHRIRELRMRKGITQIDLAKGICTPSMVSQIESDRARPSYKILYALAEKLGVPLEHLLKDVHLDLEAISLYKLAMGMVEGGEYRAAIPVLEELKGMTGAAFTLTDLQMVLGTCYLELGEQEMAVEVFVQLLEQHKVRQDPAMAANVRLLLGDAYMRRKEYPLALFHTSRALEEYNRCREEEPAQRARILTQMADLHQGMGRIAEAVKCYQEALSYVDQCGTLEDKGKMLLHLAEGYHKQKNYKLADAYSSKALALLGEAVEQNNMADWKRKLLLLRQSELPHEEMIEQLLTLAERHEQRGDKARAGEVYADIAKIGLEHSEGEANALAEAWAYAEKALLLLPYDHPALGRVHRVLALVYLQRGDEEKGGKHLDLAISIFETHGLLAEWEAVTVEMARYLDEQGKPEAALQMMNRFHSVMVAQLQERGIVL